jgi:hypothetical protein
VSVCLWLEWFERTLCVGGGLNELAVLEWFERPSVKVADVALAVLWRAAVGLTKCVVGRST